MKKWQCSVCGYIHTGDEPPETCPVCRADKSKFVEVTEDNLTQAEVVSEETAESQKPEVKEPDVKVTVVDSSASGRFDFSRLYNFAAKIILEHHLHPISVHIPNGVIPISVFFAFISVIFGLHNFELASFYNMIFVLLAMPMVLFSGYTEWQRHYKGARTGIFLTKMFCGIIVLVTSLILVIWWMWNPGIASSLSPVRWIFFMIHLIMLSAAGVAGYLGGKLVFKD